ncbi:hypothetical protein [Sphingomonas sp. RB1R13]|uniref:hypothetical protein n=1 Tax=Sphingomonas sp. RB1R13 TaxID=3096159 RepID=UPI002FCB6D49
MTSAMFTGLLGSSPLTSDYQLLIDKIGEQFTQFGGALVRRDVIFIEQNRFERFK